MELFKRNREIGEMLGDHKAQLKCLQFSADNMEGIPREVMNLQTSVNSFLNDLKSSPAMSAQSNPENDNLLSTQFESLSGSIESLEKIVDQSSKYFDGFKIALPDALKKNKTIQNEQSDISNKNHLRTLAKICSSALKPVTCM